MFDTYRPIRSFWLQMDCRSCWCCRRGSGNRRVRMECRDNRIYQHRPLCHLCQWFCPFCQSCDWTRYRHKCERRRDCIDQSSTWIRCRLRIVWQVDSLSADIVPTTADARQSHFRSPDSLGRRQNRSVPSIVHTHRLCRSISIRTNGPSPNDLAHSLDYGIYAEMLVPMKLTLLLDITLVQPRRVPSFLCFSLRFDLLFFRLHFNEFNQ